MVNILKKIFGSRNDRLLKQYRRKVVAANGFEAAISKLSDDQLRAKTDEFRARIKAHLDAANVSGGAGQDKAEADKAHEKALREVLDEILPEAFAVVREGSKRVFKMRHFDVQMLGGMALHNGKIAEMRTGEGKTLTATLLSLEDLTSRLTVLTLDATAHPEQLPRLRMLLKDLAGALDA